MFGFVLLLHIVVALLNFICVSAMVILIFPTLDILWIVSWGAMLTSARLTWGIADCIVHGGDWGTLLSDAELATGVSAVARHWVALFQKRVDVPSLLPVVSEAETKSELRCQKILLVLRMLLALLFFPHFEIIVLVFLVFWSLVLNSLKLNLLNER